MKKIGSSVFSSRLFCWLLLITGISGIGYFSYQYFDFVYKREHQSAQAAFEKALLITEEKLHSYVFGLQGMGGVYLTLDFGIIPNEVRRYAHFRNYFDNFHGALGFGFIRYIPQSEIKSYEKRALLKMPDFKIKRLSRDSYPDYMIIENIEPMEKNQEARGLDVGSEKNRRAAAIKAMETGMPAITDQIQLVQVDRNEPGFLYYLPIYKYGEVPSTLEKRRKEIVGWAYAPILASAIGEHIKVSISTKIDFAVYEVGGDGQMKKIYGSSPDSEYEMQRQVYIGGKAWIFKASYKEIGILKYHWFLPLVFFVLVSTIYSLLCLYIRRLILNKEVTENRAKNIEDQFQALINGSSFLIMSTDVNGVIVTVNKTALRLLGYTQEELLSGSVSPELFHRYDEMVERSKALSEEFKTDIKAGFRVFTYKADLFKVDIHEWSYVRKDGTSFPVRLVVTPIYDNQNRIEGYLGIAEDITEIVSMRKTIQHQQQQIITSAKLSSLGEMASGIAHEINNPLTIITSRLKLVQQKISQHGIDNDKLIEELDKIERTTFRIAKIVKGLKSFSRESSEDPKVLVPLSEILVETLDLCGERFKHHEIKVIVKDCPNVHLLCRSSQISQVLLNLLGNSFDAVQNLDKKWIEIDFEMKVSSITISITDSGSGIPPHIVDKIMTPFFSTKEVGKGTGLGLSISKGIIEEHGGALIYDRNSPNTRFLVILPLPSE